MKKIINIVGKWKGVIKDNMSVRVSVISGLVLKNNITRISQSLNLLPSGKIILNFWSLVLHIAIADSSKLMKLHSKC